MTVEKFNTYGNFFIRLGNEVTKPISIYATHKNVISVLDKLHGGGKVVCFIVGRKFI